MAVPNIPVPQAPTPKGKGLMASILTGQTEGQKPSLQVTMEATEQEFVIRIPRRIAYSQLRDNDKSSLLACIAEAPKDSNAIVTMEPMDIAKLTEKPYDGPAKVYSMPLRATMTFNVMLNPKQMQPVEQGA